MNIIDKIRRLSAKGDFYDRLYRHLTAPKIMEASRKDFNRSLRLKGNIGKPKSKKIKRLKREGKAFRVVCNLEVL